ncbi:hypothetical protein N7G274_009342 [Stereocaulon virgatum]|uniref:Uncharacterized protein n=1 Tax=Stereocaulon virgatum TaxID=373712 RepID=A0ABR3ZW80_9LECA
MAKDGRELCATSGNTKVGCKRFGGETSNSSHRLDLFVVWDNINAADAFRASPTFETTFTWIAIFSLTTHCVSPKGTISTHGSTEKVTLFFPASTSQEDVPIFESQVGGFTAESFSADSPHMLPESVAHGWTINDDRNDQQEIKACAVFIWWYDLDRMYNLKQDKTSLFNNLSVPLLIEASLESTAAMYTQLNNVRIEEFGSVVM